MTSSRSFFRDEEGIAYLDGLEYAGILGDVFDDHAFELVIFFGGGDVQGLDLEIGHALRGELVHRGVDGKDGFAFLRQLIADDVRGEGQKHGFFPGGFFVGLFNVVDCGPCAVHRSSEGDEQGARLGKGGSGGQQAAQQNHDETFFHGNSLIQSSWIGRNARRRPYHMAFRLVSRLEDLLCPRLPMNGVHSGCCGFIPSHGCGVSVVFTNFPIIPKDSGT